MANGISAGLTRTEGRKFGLTLGIAFGLLAALLLWRDHGTLSAIAGILGLSLATAGLLIPRQLGPVQKVWLRFGLLLSRITTPLILGVLYLLVFTPIGLVIRMRGRNPLVHQATNNSYWVQRPPARGKAGLQRQY